jgi:hypothetical protein
VRGRIHCLPMNCKVQEGHVDVSYAAPQAHGIINVALHQEYLSGIVFFNPKGSSNSIMSKIY